MLESGSSLPLRFRLLNAVGRTLGAEKLTFARFDEELLREAAVKETGLTDFGDPYHRDGLLQLLQSAEEDADLHFVGRLAYRELIINALASRLQLIEARKRTSPGRVFDVHYKRLVADPIRAVREIYDHYELGWSEVFEQRLVAYVRDNPKGRHGVHRYSATTFGQTDEQIAERFTTYRERFGCAY